MATDRDKRRNQLYDFLDEAVTYFQKENKNLIPTRSQLLSAALELKKLKRRRLPISAQDVANYYLQGGPDEFVRFTRPRKIRPKYFQSLPTIKLGMWHIDYAEYQKNWAHLNNGKNGFILAVENFTNKLFVYPCKGGSNTLNWLKAIKLLVKKYPYINSFYSDPDPVATSPKFRRLIHNKYKIRWLYLRKNVKSFLAERYIGYVKNVLSLTIGINSQAKNEIEGKWVKYVEPLIEAYNKQIIPRTKFRRCDVNKDNFDKFLQQLTGLKHPDMKFYLSRAGPFKNPQWNRLLFKFDLGQKVFINPDANYHLIKGKRFNWKRSIKGSYDPKIFTISGRQLRASKMHANILVPMYSLAEFDRAFATDYPARNAAEQKVIDEKLARRQTAIQRKLNFYENDLIAVPMRQRKI